MSCMGHRAFVLVSVNLLQVNLLWAETMAANIGDIKVISTHQILLLVIKCRHCVVDCNSICHNRNYLIAILQEDWDAMLTDNKVTCKQQCIPLSRCNWCSMAHGKLLFVGVYPILLLFQYIVWDDETTITCFYLNIPLSWYNIYHYCLENIYQKLNWNFLWSVYIHMLFSV